MKKPIFVFLAIALLLALAACGGTGSSGSASSETSGGTGSTTDTSTALSLEMQLLVGTFKLEDTDLAVDAQQAAQLLPLWQVLQSLLASDTAASEEITAVINQIEATMSAPQMEAITAMELTQEDVMTVMSEAVVFPSSSSDSGASGDAAGSGQRSFSAGGPSGVIVVEGSGPPPGGDAGGFVIQGNDPGLGPQQMATAQAGGQSAGSNSQLPMPLLRALIDLLQKKAQP